MPVLLPVNFTLNLRTIMGYITMLFNNFFISKRKFFLWLMATSLGSGVLPVTGFGASTDQQYTIELKSRTFLPEPVIIEAIPTAKNYHAMVQFYELPDETQRNSLEEAGILLLEYLPKNTWITSIKSSQTMREQQEQLNIRWSGKLLPSDKVSPEIAANTFGDWAKNGDGTVNLSVRVFADINLDEMNNRVVARGGEVTEIVSMLSILKIKWPESSSLLELAEEDGIQWIEQVSPPKEELNDGLRANIDADWVQMPLYNGYGLSGNGIITAIWDSGHVDGTHSDFTGRVSYGDIASVSTHATHVAGTMAGAGIINPLYKGVTPLAQIISYDWLNPTLEHNSIHDVSQNSWGYGVSSVAGNCSLYGDYAINAPDYDEIVTGLQVPGNRIPVVFAAGNDRNDGDCGMSPVSPYINYANILPGGQTAKNTITVGAINSDNYAMTDFSSWGPTDDGRIKPEVVAPGDESGAPKIKSTLPGNTYGDNAGTSMAAPAVSGSIALLKEQYNKICSTSTAILPSTLKALLIHTAWDLDDASTWYNPGPDYASGYGAINIKDAIDMLPFHIESSISNGGTDEYQVVVTEQQDLKVTLVWDDPAAALLAATTLVNNLDLELEAPSGTIYHPWTLNPASPASSATTGVDNVNVVEQVSVTTVSSAMTGTWTIRVKGTSVPVGPQSYSLISPHLANYSSCPSPNGADVWIKDGSGDTGTEPSSPGSCGGWWCSQDIVITHNNSATTGLGQPLPTHQNPEVGQSNFAYVLVRNRGTQPAYNVRVNLYLTPAATGLSWPGNWNLIGSSTIPELPENQTYLIDPVIWNPPATGHYCMVARLVTPQDPMTFPEGSSITINDRENNNIAWRNLNIVDLLPHSTISVDFIIRNIFPVNATARLALRATNTKGEPIAIGAKANKTVLTWPNTLRVRGPVEGFVVREELGSDNTSGKVTGEQATIGGIEMAGHEEHTLSLSFNTSTLSREELPKKYFLHVEQYADNEAEPIGGITYEVRPAVPMAVTLSDFRASASAKEAYLEWETAKETNHAKFTIWRGNPLNGTCTNNPLNYDDVRIIASVNTTETGTFYSEIDSDIKSGETYCYLLEDTDFSGNKNYHWDFLRSITIPTGNNIQ